MTHPFGLFSLLPPVVAILLAIVTRRVVPSLFAGVFCGALILADWHPWTALVATFETHLWNTLIDPSKLRVFAFTLLMGSLVGVITRSGGMRGLVRVISKWASNRRRGQLTVWILGLVIFFDDYANTLLLGSTLRPLCDRLRISREKLAYLVDSTAAPVAGLALVSTWIAVEIDYVREGLNQLGSESELTAFGLFVDSIPYRFYVLLSLLFVPLVAVMRRDFGPMRKAELSRQTDDPPTDPAEAQEFAATGGKPSDRWFNAVIPIGVTVTVVVLLIIQTGKESVLAAGGDTGWMNVFGSGDSSLALQYGAIAGLVVAAAMAWAQRLATWDEIVSASAAGARLVVPAIAILWFASSLSRMTGNTAVDGASSESPYPFQTDRLYTGEYLQQVLLGGDASAPEAIATDRAESLRRWLPTLVFVLSAVVSFCTGTSFGTMGILIPMTVTLAYAVSAKLSGGTVPAGDPVLLGSLGSVLAGAIFGDHCSPISDTTILSSQASGCDHMQHVWTQMPYAVTVAVVAILAGTIPVGFGASPLLVLPVQALLLFAILQVLGRRV